MLNVRALLPVRRAAVGSSLVKALVIGLAVLFLGGGLAAVLMAVDARKQVTVTFSNWYENKPGLARAIAEQQATHKPFLLYLYATWCPHCKEFTAKVLTQKPVRDYMNNYPHVRVEPDHGPAEMAIMQDYGATGYPSFYVVMPDGKRIQVETHVMSANPPRLKTPQEFINSIRKITGGP